MPKDTKKQEQENKEENKTLKECMQKSEEYLNGWKRERADFLNYKKEESERMTGLLRFATEEFILRLLPILDNFCLAEKHISKNEESAGFLQIKKQLEDLLAKEGIVHIEVLGKQFDPNNMEAAEEVENLEESAEYKSGSVIEEVQRGYTLHGKLLRPAKVKIVK